MIKVFFARGHPSERSERGGGPGGGLPPPDLAYRSGRYGEEECEWWDSGRGWAFERSRDLRRLGGPKTA